MFKYYRCILVILTIGFLAAWACGVDAAENKPLFVSRHDESVFGKFLSARKIENSLPSNDVCVQGDFLYAAGSDHVTVYHLADSKQPRQVAQIRGLGECRQIDYYKGVLYVTARTFGMYIIDVSDPFHPWLRCHYDTMELATGIKCDDNIACIAQRQFGTEFVDISDPGNPRHLGHILSGEAQSVDRANGIVYIGDWGTRELTIVDARNPRHPQILSQVPLDGLGDGVYIRDDICYAATGLYVPLYRANKANPLDPVNKGGHGLDIYSVKDLARPVLLGRIKFPRQPVHLTPDYWAVEVTKNKIAYVADAYNGFFCLNLSDPRHPKGLAHTVLPTVGKSGNPDPVGGSAAVKDVFYLAGCRNGVYVVEAPGLAQRLEQERTAPSLQTPIPPDATPDPLTAKKFTIFKPGGQVVAAAGHDDRSVWIASGMTGIQLVDIVSKPPVALAVYPTRGFAYDVKKVGDLLFTAEGDDGMAVYRIHSNGTLKFLSRYDCGLPVRQVTVPLPGKYAIIKAGNSALRFIDISRPDAIRYVCNNKTRINGILYGRDLVDGLMAGKYAACVAQGTGLLWFDLSGEKPETSFVSYPNNISFADGACIDGGKLYLIHGRALYESLPNDPVPLAEKKKSTIKEIPYFGKVSMEGNILSYTSRRSGTVCKLDMTEKDHPRFIEQYETGGHPELTLFHQGKMIIPCGYTGLLIEK